MPTRTISLNAIILTPTSPHFPAALQSRMLRAPCPQLWALGNLDILTMPLLGFFCATRCPGDVILHTYALALREAGVPVIGGFHTPMEKECLEVLLRGQQPVVICPAHDIERLRMPMSWRKPYGEGRLLVLSPFLARQRRPTTALVEHRNRFVATLATHIFVAYAGAGRLRRVGSGEKWLCILLHGKSCPSRYDSSTVNPVREASLPSL